MKAIARESVLALVEDREVDAAQTRPARGSTLVLRRDERLQIIAEDGRPLVEVSYDAQGPRVRLLPADTRITLDGKLCVDAESIELRARGGDVSVEASKEVVVLGQVVRIN